ncbi:trypsin-like peptidase domain-containing protein [Pseudomonas oryzihabitans]|uniref:S1C family serine protease n=1 Tax=Pseudomonas oryzihabitans TaxID=47885 RepID=UPI001F528004|nr:serine protease [Pseudomonas oryzihabitans]MCI1007794.1 trypsin-like peptidase domain-containing protein [Pseudomonas oryzihabitans]
MIYLTSSAIKVLLILGRITMLRTAVSTHAGGCIMIAKIAEGEQLSFAGTGFICHPKGYILTCAHILNLTERYCIIPPQPFNQFNNMTITYPQILETSVAQYDPENDVALLKIKNNSEISMPNNIFGAPEKIPVGATVCYLGYPYGQQGLHTLKASQGIVSSKVISTNGTNQFQIDAMIHEGNSGGPLIDVNTNQIIGLINGRFSPTGSQGSIFIGSHALGTDSTISFATTIDYGVELLKSEGVNLGII